MDDFDVLILLIAPLVAVHAHPFPFVGLVVVATAFSWIILKTMPDRIKWAICIPLLLAAIWGGSLLIMFVLKLPGFPPH